MAEKTTKEKQAEITAKEEEISEMQTQVIAKERAKTALEIERQVLKNEFEVLQIAEKDKEAADIQAKIEEENINKQEKIDEKKAKIDASGLDDSIKAIIKELIK